MLSVSVRLHEAERDSVPTSSIHSTGYKEHTVAWSVGCMNPHSSASLSTCGCDSQNPQHTPKHTLSLPEVQCVSHEERDPLSWSWILLPPSRKDLSLRGTEHCHGVSASFLLTQACPSPSGVV